MVPTSIEKSIRIEAEPRVVFDALTDPSLVRRWLCHDVEIEPKAGGRIDMRWSAIDRGASIRYEGSAEIVDFAPPARLAFRLAPSDGPGPESVVEFRLAGTGGATDVVLAQSGFPDGAAGQRARDAYARGWTPCLETLRSLIEDEPAARLSAALMSRDVPLPGQDPCGIAWDGSALWVSDAGRGRIFRLDAWSGRTTQSFAFEGEPAGLAYDGEALWQADREERVLVKIGPDGGRTLKRLECAHAQGELTGVAWDGEHLWVGDGGEDDGRVLKINPRSGIVFHKLSVGPGVSGLAWDGHALWLAEFETRTLKRVDPRTGDVIARLAVKGHPTGLTWDGERLWYADAEWKVASRVLEPAG